MSICCCKFAYILPKRGGGRPFGETQKFLPFWLQSVSDLWWGLAYCSRRDHGCCAVPNRFRFEGHFISQHTRDLKNKLQDSMLSNHFESSIDMLIFLEKYLTLFIVHTVNTKLTSDQNTHGVCYLHMFIHICSSEKQISMEVGTLEETEWCQGLRDKQL